MANAFEKILGRLEASDDTVTEKTASAEQEQTSEARMIEKVREISDASTKTASDQSNEPSPAVNLEQMAKSAHDAENQKLIKEAHFLGASVCDGFMERFAQYDTALAQQGIKSASAVPAADKKTLQKAAQFGYAKAQKDMEKQAHDAYEKGYKDQLVAVHKTAAEIHLAGQAVAYNIIEQNKQSTQ
jgi:hypothetical protein